MHDFIGLIFYVFRRAIPPALIGLAAGAALLVPLDRTSRGDSASVVLPGRAGRGHAYGPHGGRDTNAHSAPPVFGLLGGVERLCPSGLAESSVEYCHASPPGSAAPFVGETVSAVVLDAGCGSGRVVFN